MSVNTSVVVILLEVLARMSPSTANMAKAVVTANIPSTENRQEESVETCCPDLSPSSAACFKRFVRRKLTPVARAAIATATPLPARMLLVTVDMANGFPLDDRGDK